MAADRLPTSVTPSSQEEAWNGEALTLSAADRSSHGVGLQRVARRLRIHEHDAAPGTGCLGVTGGADRWKP